MKTDDFEEIACENSEDDIIDNHVINIRQGNSCKNLQTIDCIMSDNTKSGKDHGISDKIFKRNDSELSFSKQEIYLKVKVTECNTLKNVGTIENENNFKGMDSCDLVNESLKMYSVDNDFEEGDHEDVSLIGDSFYHYIENKMPILQIFKMKLYQFCIPRNCWNKNQQMIG